MEINKIYQGDALEVLRTFPDESVNCCVTSPPYYGLRDYNTTPMIWDGDKSCEHEFNTGIKKGITGSECKLIGAGKAMTEARYTSDSTYAFCSKCGAWKGELGLEPTPELYVKHLVEIFREVNRVLKKDGTCWLNLGDSYAGSGCGRNGNGEIGVLNSAKQRSNKGANIGNLHGITKTGEGLKPKDLIGIPWMVAFALRADGWYLRQDIIWHKPNPMPESVTDRCTKSHEYIFLLAKSQRYYYDQDAIMQPVADATVQRMAQQIDKQKGSDRVPGKTNGPMKAVGSGRIPRLGGGLANKKSVWTVPTMPFKEAHFATFPPNLIIDCIKAGCPEGGIVLDPFIGAGTTGLVAKKLNHNYVGIELNPEYIKIAEKRIFNEIGLFQ